MRYLVAALLLFTSAFAQPKPDVVVRAIHGKVHTVHVESKRGDDPFTLEADQTFDPEGWLIEEKRYGLNNQLMLHQTFKRNGARVIEHDSTQYFPQEFAGRTVTTFEEHGFPIQQIKYTLDGTVRERMQVVYEETQIRELHYDSNDKLVSTRTISTLHDPDSPDRHIEQRVNGNPETITDVHKDGEHVEVKQKEYKDGEVSGQVMRDLHPGTSTTAIVRADGSSEASSTRNGEFDETIHPDGSRMKSKFNEAGLRVEQDDYDAAGKLTAKTTYAYETDEHGNWTRRTSVDSTDPGMLAVIVRTFTYY